MLDQWICRCAGWKLMIDVVTALFLRQPQGHILRVNS